MNKLSLLIHQKQTRSKSSNRSEAVIAPTNRIEDSRNRRNFIGGSDAHIVMGSDEAALIQLRREKRGEADPEDLNRSWYERNTGRRISDVQRHIKHSAIPWMAATLDGIVDGIEAVFE